jgi:hypothetical protein
MRFLSRLFGAEKSGMDKASHFLDEAERLADHENPLPAMEFLSRIPAGSQDFIGPSGPLHDRFILILHKVKSRVFVGNLDSPRHSERNWANLPSVLQVPLVGEKVEIRALLRAVQERARELVWLVPAASSPTQQDARTMVDYTFHFADDPKLALQFHAWNGNLLIRSRFLLEVGPQLNSPTVGDMLVDLLRLAQARGLTVETI